MSELPHGLKLLDLGIGMSAALVAKQLVELGISAQRIEPPESDPFYELLPAYRFWRQGEQVNNLSIGSEEFQQLLLTSDICICGGEQFPGLDWHFAPESLLELNPSLVVLDITPAPEHLAVAAGDELMVQARAGIFQELYGDQPVFSPFPVAAYGAALNGSLGLWAALYEREKSGRGQVVSVSLFEGALSWLGHTWIDLAEPSPTLDMSIPRKARHYIFQCADGKHIHLSPGVPNAMAILGELLGMDASSDNLDARGMPKAASEDHYFGDIDAFQKYIGQWESEDLLQALIEAGIPVERNLLPGECWDDAQVEHNGIVQRDSEGWQFVGSPLKGLEQEAPS